MHPIVRAASERASDVNIPKEMSAIFIDKQRLLIFGFNIVHDDSDANKITRDDSIIIVGCISITGVVKTARAATDAFSEKYHLIVLYMMVQAVDKNKIEMAVFILKIVNQFSGEAKFAMAVNK